MLVFRHWNFRPRAAAALVIGTLPMTLAWFDAGAPPLPKYTDITKAAGITFHHQNGATGQKYYPETIGSGCAFVDFDNDGFPDIYLVNGAAFPGYKSDQPIRGALYRNNGDGTFTDITAKSGAAVEGLYGMGVAAGDLDNDGFVDLYVTGFGRSVLLHNNGNGTFTDLSDKAGVTNTGKWGTSAAFFDYDNDGYLDLYVANYVQFELDKNVYCGDTQRGMRSYCRPDVYKGTSGVLFHNNQNGTFTDQTVEAGLFNPEGKGLGVVAADLDGDGNIDLYVANDGVANYLYRNLGNGKFQNIAPFAGVAYGADGQTRAGMGVDVADFNQDGRPDIVVTNFSLEGASLFQNDGDNQFREVSFQTGLRKATFAYTGWGVGFLDFDNDGKRDIFIVNGHPEDNIERVSGFLTYAQPALLLSNVGSGFANIASTAGTHLTQKRVSRGVAFGDTDNDGDLDVLIANNAGSPTLLRNDGGNRNNWLELKLVGTSCNRDAVGAKVTIRSGDLVQTDQVRGGGSYLSAHDRRLHFGIGIRKSIERIDISWPNRKTQQVRNIKPNQCLTIREPA